MGQLSGAAGAGTALSRRALRARAHPRPTGVVRGVSGVTVLRGEIPGPALQAAIRRIKLLGGRVVAMFAIASGR